VKNLAEKIAAIRERRTQDMLAQLDQTREDQISLTDPDSRAMAAHTHVAVGYYVQVAVDTKHKLIVERFARSLVWRTKQCWIGWRLVWRSALGRSIAGVIRSEGFDEAAGFAVVPYNPPLKFVLEHQRPILYLLLERADDEIEWLCEKLPLVEQNI
jgi:hypothetical protein